MARRVLLKYWLRALAMAGVVVMAASDKDVDSTSVVRRRGSADIIAQQRMLRRGSDDIFAVEPDGQVNVNQHDNRMNLEGAVLTAYEVDSGGQLVHNPSHVRSTTADNDDSGGRLVHNPIHGRSKPVRSQGRPHLIQGMARSEKQTENEATKVEPTDLFNKAVTSTVREMPREEAKVGGGNGAAPSLTPDGEGFTDRQADSDPKTANQGMSRSEKQSENEATKMMPTDLVNKAVTSQVREVLREDAKVGGGNGAAAGWHKRRWASGTSGKFVQNDAQDPVAVVPMPPANAALVPNVPATAAGTVAPVAPMAPVAMAPVAAPQEESEGSGVIMWILTTVGLLALMVGAIIACLGVARAVKNRQALVLTDKDGQQRYRKLPMPQHSDEEEISNDDVIRRSFTIPPSNNSRSATIPFDRSPREGRNMKVGKTRTGPAGNTRSKSTQEHSMEKSPVPSPRSLKLARTLSPERAKFFNDSGASSQDANMKW